MNLNIDKLFTIIGTLYVENIILKEEINKFKKDSEEKKEKK